MPMAYPGLPSFSFKASVYWLLGWSFSMASTVLHGHTSRQFLFLYVKAAKTRTSVSRTQPESLNHCLLMSSQLLNLLHLTLPILVHCCKTNCIESGYTDSVTWLIVCVWVGGGGVAAQVDKTSWGLEEAGAVVFMKIVLHCNTQWWHTWLFQTWMGHRVADAEIPEYKMRLSTCVSPESGGWWWWLWASLWNDSLWSQWWV